MIQLADLNGDGGVDQQDLDMFVVQFKIIKAANGNFSVDLNGDGAVTNFEHRWPLIDLNGSGRVSLEDHDRRMINGTLVSDIDLIRLAWTDENNPFPDMQAIAERMANN